MSEPTPWHKLFRLTLVDFFRDLPVTVELEKDLSLKHHLLDVAIICKDRSPLSVSLPDGFDNHLSLHNLISFKSFREALDGWALNELVSYYVNYRKQISPSMQKLLPETDFQLFAVCVRVPEALARSVALTLVKPGVYEVRHFTGTICVIVIHELPKVENNALLHLFIASMDQIRYAALHYHQRSTETSTLLRQLLQRYNLEVSLMPTGMEQLKQLAEETIEELLKELPAERRLKGLSPEQLLAALTPNDRLALERLIKNEGSAVVPPPTEPEGDHN